MKKRSRKIVIIKSIATFFLVLQVLSHIGRLNKEPYVFEEISEMIGYYIGLNIALIISIVLYYIAFRMKRKMMYQNLTEKIDAIGKNE